MVLVLRNGRFTLYLIVMTGFYFIYNQVYNVLPLYVKRVVETNPAMDLYTAANPFVIVCFQLIISRHVRQDEADPLDGGRHGDHRASRCSSTCCRSTRPAGRRR